MLRLYGTTPPRSGTADDAMEGIAEKLAVRLRGLAPDGVVVYDIQDESGRTELPRPFAFSGTVDPRIYARLIGDRIGQPTITYKCVGDLDAAGWHTWLTDTAATYGPGCLSIVGRPTSGVRYPLALADAIRLAARHPAGFTIGGVVIAERHSDSRSESARMLAKTRDGCAYFISQTIYHPNETVRLLEDYLRDCRTAGEAPLRVVLTFSPAGREKTIVFLRWLGVHIPFETERAILSAADPIARSVEICRDNLRQILDHPYATEIPLGINVESVSTSRAEIDASADLFHELDGIVRERWG